MKEARLRPFVFGLALLVAQLLPVGAARADGGAPLSMLPANSAWRPAGDGDPARLREGARVALAVGDWLCAIAGVDFAVAMAGVGLLVADAHTPPPPCTGGRCALGSSDYFVEGFGLTLAAGVGWLLSTIATAAAYQVGADRREKVRALPRATANGLRWVF